MYYRIQKLLLLGEYRGGGCADDDSVKILIESPFAQVDSCGRGIRAVQLGLSRGWLFVAVDDFVANPRADYHRPCYDPEVDCLELLCALPLRFVRLKLERHHGAATGGGGGRQEVLRVTLVTGRRLYFEFGGDGRLRPLMVNAWWDRIQELRRCKKVKAQKRREGNANDRCESRSSGSESLLLEKLPEHLRPFFERTRRRRERDKDHDGCSDGCDKGSTTSRASTDVESCIYEWDRRHKTKEKQRMAKRMASLLAGNCQQQQPQGKP